MKSISQAAPYDWISVGTKVRSYLIFILGKSNGWM
jgi:hypothetical protein